MIKWQYYPKSREVPAHLRAVIEDVFSLNENKISSSKHKYESNDVLRIVRKGLENNGFVVERGKKKAEKINVPVLYGERGKPEKSFDADGWNKATKTVIEIEAGRAVTNNQFLKDLFQACVMHDIDYLIICIRNRYRKSDDYDRVINFMNTLYASDRLNLPLQGILIVGY